MSDLRTPLPPELATPLSLRQRAGHENFPVASRLFPAAIRAHILAFYRFVRLADDIADHPFLETEVKHALLAALEQTLLTGRVTNPITEPALALRTSLMVTGLDSRPVQDLLRAFRNEAGGCRCQTWSDLEASCALSAVPVGRYLLALHHETSPAALAAADALCVALQLLNHIQDCRDDWCRLGRLYLPQTLFTAAGISVERLVETRSDPPLRQVFTLALARVESLLAQARPLPATLRNPALRLEAAVMLALAADLARRLAQRDPLAERVRLPLAARCVATLRGLWHGWRAGRSRKRHGGDPSARDPAVSCTPRTRPPA